MEEFLRRVEYATRNFGASEPGWRTDRARIHVRYGEADEIQFLARNGSRPDTEIWYYYRRSLSFVFQDVEGFGEYRLSGSRR
jgi:GWxTD domain-containing protein